MRGSIEEVSSVHIDSRKERHGKQAIAVGSNANATYVRKSSESHVMLTLPEYISTAPLYPVRFTQDTNVLWFLNTTSKSIISVSVSAQMSKSCAEQSTTAFSVPKRYGKLSCFALCVPPQSTL